MEYVGWDKVTTGTLLHSFEGEFADAVTTKQDDRPYAWTNSINASVADWRVLKPVYNRDICIDCQNCWIFCPDTSIISRDKKMIGIDFDHCKGCGVCVEVCPTNPKSLLMFSDFKDNEEALSEWPEKKKRGAK
jgi:pyruvate ferredoxin oxidoreductase delta subunit